jgi:glutathione S-transferase
MVDINLFVKRRETHPMKLYFAETINARKACAAAKYVGAPVEFIRIDLRSSEHKKPPFTALNPNAKVPVLESGGATLWESNAIMCRLGEATGSDFWPRDNRQIDVMRWMFWSSEHFSRYTSRLYFENLVKQIFGLGAPNPASVEEAKGYVRQYGQVLDDHLRGRHFLVGDRPTAADFAVGAALPYAERAQLPLDGFHEIARWKTRLESLPAWSNPFPAAQAA